MSKRDSRKRVKRGQSDGDYKADLPPGVINKFQADWYDPPNCPRQKHWLKDGGLDDMSEYVAQCILCQTSFQCRTQAVKAHEQGKKHKDHIAAWQQAQKGKAAWQQWFARSHAESRWESG
eukprot:794728-Pelagomonas_calceolata.AAC.2